MTTHTTWYCPTCGSTDVDQLVYGWQKANHETVADGEIVDIDIAELYPVKYWCQRCYDADPDNFEGCTHLEYRVEEDTA